MNALLQCRHRTFPVALYLALGAVALLGFAARTQAQAFSSPGAPTATNTTIIGASGPNYPDAPSVTLLSAASTGRANETEANAEEQRRLMATNLPPCPIPVPPLPSTMPSAPPAPPAPCRQEDPLRIIVNFEQRQPLTSRQKGMLAIKDVIDPFNLVVITGEAAIGVASNSHSAYGPGFKGFGRLAGYTLVQDATGEFFGTFLIPSLAHEDPRYRRMQNASVQRRIVHALQRTIIAQHDDGRYMPNYATLLTYPITAELSNLYVPGVQTNGRATGRRIGIGLATDPVGNLLAEFLPDIARRIHIRSVFIQQIVNQMATGQPIGNIQ